MATLILTTVGSVIGGPIGGAIGGLIGSAIDRTVLFPPKPREGPRLTELAVLTSSYGTQIPKLFGTMRVAGTVIWSTDLIESRSTSHAKGQPSVTTYSYSASFAVLLSARPIRDVRRIWAEGKLLRGAAGDLKVQTGYRLHMGGEDQPVDPLIASIEGERTPANRGGAYVVFENLQLADYGNRIPSLTFEVVADEGSVSVGRIAATIAPEVDADVALPLGGFAVSGGSVAGALSTLIEMSGAHAADTGSGLTLRDQPRSMVAVGDDGYAARGAGRTRHLSRGPADAVPKTLSISHYDPARDYQAGLQRVTRPGPGNRDVRLEAPAALDAGSAKALASVALLRAEAVRETRTVALGLAGLALTPGDGVFIEGETDRWLVRDSSVEAMVTTVTLEPLSTGELHRDADSGAVVAATDDIAGPTILVAAEIPGLDDTLLSAPQLAVFATGADPGWRRANLLVSLDDGDSWQPIGDTAAAATIGAIDTPPPAGSTDLVDLHGTLIVTLARRGDVLIDADDRQLDAGVNLALVGDELLQFGTAVPLGDGRWRLSHLLRGRRGTERAVGAQAKGDRFVLLDKAAMTVVPLPLSAIGGSVRVMASGIGDMVAPAEQTATIGGASVAPPSPAALSIANLPGGDARLTWIRRSRSGWRWTDGIETPLSEETERYRVTLTSDGGTRVVDTPQPSIAIPEADLVGVKRVEVRQLGTYAASPAAICAL